MTTNNNFLNEIMNQIKKDFYKEGNIDNYNIWFSKINIRIEGSIITIFVPSLFFQNQFIKKNYLNLIQQKIYEKKQERFVIKIQLEEEHPKIDDKPVKENFNNFDVEDVKMKGMMTIAIKNPIRYAELFDEERKNPNVFGFSPEISALIRLREELKAQDRLKHSFCQCL
jgi:chromosomal replication initiation ATPase DnaA